MAASSLLFLLSAPGSIREAGARGRRRRRVPGPSPRGPHPAGSVLNARCSTRSWPSLPSTSSEWCAPPQPPAHRTGLTLLVCLQGMALYKLKMLGLLPTSDSDWLEFQTAAPVRTRPSSHAAARYPQHPPSRRSCPSQRREQEHGAATAKPPRRLWHGAPRGEGDTAWCKMDAPSTRSLGA